MQLIEYLFIGSFVLGGLALCSLIIQHIIQD